METYDTLKRMLEAQHRAELLAIRHKLDEEIRWCRLKLKDVTDHKEEMRWSGMVAGLRVALAYIPDRYDRFHRPNEREV